MRKFMNNIIALGILLLFFNNNLLIAQTTYYYKLTKKIQKERVFTNTAGGQYITFKDNVCFDSDKYGKSVNNGELVLNEQYSKSSKTYIGNSYFGSVVYRFKADLSVLNIVVNKNLIYVYKRTSPPESQITSSLIRENRQKATYSISTIPPMNTFSNTIVPPNNNHSDSYNHEGKKDEISNNTYNYETRRKDILNNTYGEKCNHCNGNGKCPTCGGTKIVRSFGNTYKCTVCNTNGDCPVCQGTGKPSWNK